MTLKIKVYSDYVCPYCFIAEKLLEEATRNKDVEIEWMPFELRPAPQETLRPEGEYLRRAWENSVWPTAKRYISLTDAGDELLGAFGPLCSNRVRRRRIEVIAGRAESADSIARFLLKTLPLVWYFLVFCCLHSSFRLEIEVLFRASIYKYLARAPSEIRSAHSVHT